MALEIRETAIGGKLNDFLNVVDYVYRGDPKYVRPLDMEMKDRLSLKNPFFEHAEGVIFTAHRNGWCVGRITAQIDREHLKRYNDATGSFGFLDTIDDADVTKALLERARDPNATLRERGTAALGIWQRALENNKTKDPMIQAELSGLVHTFEEPNESPDIVSGLRWIGATLKKAMADNCAVCVDLPTSEEDWYKIVDGAAYFFDVGACGPCYPDCNGDGALSVADFGCFQTRFVLNDPYADCTGDGSLSVADFGCFQTGFVVGCP